MIAGERIGRAVELLEQAKDEVRAAADDCPPYSVQALRLLAAEIQTCARRGANVQKVLRGPRTPTT